jgi:hypothetical protein
MESELGQDRSIQVDVRPVSRLLRFVLATIATLVLGGIILGVMRATGMLVGGANDFFFPSYLGQLVQLAPIVGIAAAAYPRRWLPHHRNALIVAMVGAAVGCLCYCLLQVRIAWNMHYGYVTGLQSIPWWWRYTFWQVTPDFEFQIASCWITTGALAMLVTLTRRTRAVLVAAAALCLLAVVLPSPIFNFARHNQQLTVAFVLPAIPGASASQPPYALSVATGSHWLSQAGADTVAAHILEALRKAGLPGPYRVAEVTQSGTGKKALQIIVLNPPFPADAQLPQPDGSELIYVSQPDGWHTIPAQARTLGRNTQIQGPKSGYHWLATYWVHTATSPEAFGGAIWPACSQDQSRSSDSESHQFPGCR